MLIKLRNNFQKNYAKRLAFLQFQSLFEKAI